MSLSFDSLLAIALLMALGVFVPLRLARVLPLRLGMVPVNMGLSALLLWLSGMVLMALPYLWAAPDLTHWLASDPLGGALWLARLGALPALAWAPLLALTAFGIAQRIAAVPPEPARQR